MLASSDQGLEHPEDIRLDHVVARVVRACRQAFADAAVTVHTTLEPRVVRSDPVLLEQLVRNLVDNAVKYNDGGAIWVRVGGTPALEVANTGPHVPEDKVPLLFEPFVQLRRERVAANRGVGLGLSIVHSIAHAHGGSVDAVPRRDGRRVVGISLP